MSGSRPVAKMGETALRNILSSKVGHGGKGEKKDNSLANGSVTDRLGAIRGLDV